MDTLAEKSHIYMVRHYVVYISATVHCLRMSSSAFDVTFLRVLVHSPERFMHADPEWSHQHGGGQLWQC